MDLGVDKILQSCRTWSDSAMGRNSLGLNELHYCVGEIPNERECLIWSSGDLWTLGNGFSKKSGVDIWIKVVCEMVFC